MRKKNSLLQATESWAGPGNEAISLVPGAKKELLVHTDALPKMALLTFTLFRCVCSDEI